MIQYTSIDLPYAPLGEFRVWSDARNSFSFNSLAKVSDPSSERQTQFQNELLRLSRHLNSSRIPVFVDWRNAGKRRMDKGCVGHAVASGFLTALDGPYGWIDHIQIRGASES